MYYILPNKHIFLKFFTFFLNILFFIIGKMCLGAKSAFGALLFPTHTSHLCCQQTGCVKVPKLTLSQHVWNPRYATAWYRLWKEVVGGHTIVGVQDQLCTAVIELRRHWHNLLSRNTVTWRPARGTHQPRTPTTPPKAFHEKPGCMASRDRQNMLFSEYFQDFSKFCLRVQIWSVVLRQLQKPYWVSSSFGSVIFVASWHTLLLGVLAKRCRGSWFIHSCLLFVHGDNQFANLSVPFQNDMPLDTHESAKPSCVLSYPNSLPNFSQLASSPDLTAAS